LREAGTRPEFGSAAQQGALAEGLPGNLTFARNNRSWTFVSQPLLDEKAALRISFGSTSRQDLLRKCEKYAAVST